MVQAVPAGFPKFKLNVGQVVLGPDMRKLMPLALIGATIYTLHIPHGTALGLGSAYGLLLFACLSFVYAFVCQGRTLPRPIAKIGLAWLALVVVYACSELLEFTVHGLVSIANLIAIGLFTMTVCWIRWDMSLIRRIALVSSLYMLGFLIIGIKTHFQGLTDDGDVDNFNPTGFMLLAMGIMQFLAIQGMRMTWQKIYHLTIIWMVVVLHPLCGARSVTLELLCICLMYWAWPFISSTKVTYTMTFALLVTFIAAICVLYPQWGAHMNHYRDVSDLAQTGGKNFFDGREKIWLFIEDHVSRKIWFGLGAGARIQDISSIPFSASSLYMAILLQAGIMGVCGIVAVLWTLWQTFYMGKHLIWGRIGASILFGIVIHQTFEVCLTQNQIPVGLFMWLSICIPLSFVIAENRRVTGAGMVRAMPRALPAPPKQLALPPYTGQLNHQIPSL